MVVKNSRNLINIWLLGTCFLIWIMIMLGGATRLTHAGLSIVEWQPITGILPPLTPQQWFEAFFKYQQFPEFKTINHKMTLEDFKFIFWMEYAHRLLGRIIGLFFLIPFVIFWKLNFLTNPLKKRSIIILLLGTLQGIVGWYMVKSGLVKNPTVSHYRLTLHLGLALYLYSFIFLTFLHINFFTNNDKFLLFRFSPLTIVLWLQILTMIYGGFVAGLKAGLIYNTFPLMENQWIPDEWNFYNPLWINFFENAAFVQWIHRILALTTFIVIWFSFIYYRKGENSRFILIWAIAVSSQVILGIFTLLYHVPVILGTLHQGWAVIVITVGIIAIYYHHKKNYLKPPMIICSK